MNHPALLDDEKIWTFLKISNECIFNIGELFMKIISFPWILMHFHEIWWFFMKWPLPLHFEPIVIPAWANRLWSLRTMVLGRQNDPEWPQTRGINRNDVVPRRAPGRPPIALLRPSAAQTLPGAAQILKQNVVTLSQELRYNYAVGLQKPAHMNRIVSSTNNS